MLALWKAGMLTWGHTFVSPAPPAVPAGVSWLEEQGRGMLQTLVGIDAIVNPW